MQKRNQPSLDSFVKSKIDDKLIENGKSVLLNTENPLEKRFIVAEELCTICNENLSTNGQYHITKEGFYLGVDCPKYLLEIIKKYNEKNAI